MNRLFDAAARRLAFTLDPETAHGLSIKALKSGALPVRTAKSDPRLATIVAGLPFANPLGIAAGYDKNAEVPYALQRLGFGFVEVGTLTPLPQEGNPKPRLFRLPRDKAVINRMGFNNCGHREALGRLSSDRRGGIVGINIGANKTSRDRIKDYVAGIHAFYDVASYFTANISSPNTPGLRDLQARGALQQLLKAVLDAREEAAELHDKHVPVFLKIAPDLTESDLDDIASAIQRSALDGLIVSNTTIARAKLKERRFASETGGLSGRPLFDRSTAALAKMRVRLGPYMPMIGVGGVDSAETAAEKIRAGADLVQLYTGFVYGGPGIGRRIVRGLSVLCDREHLTNLSALRDTRADEWAKRSLAE
ncbi:MAG TPA: quinone-dependent dihydroorotate dehydrogenase [Pararhizobium sp.]|nr:quinone-dependent dihydroorotate dehydrogenase [Pararhizobium sp.]